MTPVQGGSRWDSLPQTNPPIGRLIQPKYAHDDWQVMPKFEIARRQRAQCRIHGMRQQ